MRLRAVALIAAALLLSCSARDAPEGVAEFVGAWTFTPDEEWLGGFSGIDGPDGSRFAIVSDSGYFVRGRFRREGGRIAGFERFRVHTQKVPPGGRRAADRDAEGVVWDGGPLFVSLEAVHEVWRFETPEAVPEALPRHPDFAGLPLNKSLEALARERGGALLAFAETPRGGAYRLYRLGEGGWRRSAPVPAGGGFRAVGADVGPDGWLYLLERRFALPFAFATRVRRLRLDGDQVAADETLLVTPPGRHDNLEGIAVWRDGTGALRLTMVSDDNYLPVQKTEFVEYRVPPPLDPASAGR